MDGKIEIPLSKVKIGVLFIGAIAFVILGVLFINNPESWLSHKNYGGCFSYILWYLCNIYRT